MAERIELGEGLLHRTLAELRRCGEGHSECVVFWTGPSQRPCVVDRLLHPRHTAEPGGYEIDSDWLAEAWESLAREGRSIRVQVHSHPRRAFHSRTDDLYPVVHTEGLLSLVIPRFAELPQTLKDAFLARLEADGSWTGVDPIVILGGACR